MIELSLQGGIWHATSEDFRANFGTDTIPTPFFATTGAEVVRRTIQRLNPTESVVVRDHAA